MTFILGDLLCTLARRSSNDFHRLAIRYNRQVYPLSGRHTSGIQWLGGPALLMIHSFWRNSGLTRGGYRIGRPAQSILVRRSICADQFLVNPCEAEPVADQVGH